jgi:dual specificity protein kinase YAK1
MDPQWQSYADPTGTPRRHNGAGQMPREYASQPLTSGAAPAAGYKYDQYHATAPSSAGAGAVSASASPVAPPQLRDGNGDIAMSDVHDAHAGVKSYPMRPHHQSHLSGSGRASNLHSPQESSSAAQRYSPMEALSPTSPYAHPRQSPSRHAEYNAGPYFAARPPGQQLPPIQSQVSNFEGFASAGLSTHDAPFSADPKSPRRMQPALPKPVPEFRKVRAVTDLQPKNSRQPPFRRANPEGGFISVSSCTISPQF